MGCPSAGCALKAPGYLRQITLSFRQVKKNSQSPSQALSLLVQCSVNQAEKFNILVLSQGLLKPIKNANSECRFSKVILHDFTCNIIHDFECEKLARILICTTPQNSLKYFPFRQNGTVFRTNYYSADRCRVPLVTRGNLFLYNIPVCKIFTVFVLLCVLG